MSEEITRIIKIESGDSEKTVKGLKDEIKSLRDALLNVEKGSEEYKKIVEQLINDEKTLTETMRAGKNEVSAATGSYNALQNEMTALKKVWKEVTDEASRNEIGARINEINTQLKEMDASTGNFQRNVGNYTNAVTGLTEAYVSQKQELRELKIALEQLVPGTEAYNQAFTRAAEITHNLSEQQELLKYSAADLGTQLSNIRGIATGMIGGFSALNAAMGLFGKENEDVLKAMQKTQQLMAIVQGLQGMEGMIKRLKGLTTALKSTTIAQKGLNKAIAANPIGLLLTALALLIVYWKDIWNWVVKLIGGFEKLNDILDAVKSRLAGFGNTILQFVLMPLRETIAIMKLFGNVLKDLFTGNWSALGEDIKEGVKNWVEEVKHGYSLVSNYREGYNKQEEKNAKKREERRRKALEEKTRKNLEQYTKDKDDYIKDQEAKLGADWKWSEEGQKAYRELFAARMQMYAKDSEEYKKAQRDMWSYERELKERGNKSTGGGGKSQAEIDAEAAEKRKEAYEKVADYANTIAWNEEKIAKRQKEMEDAIRAYCGTTEGVIELEEARKKLLEERATLYAESYDNIDKAVAKLKELGLDGTEVYNKLIEKQKELADEAAKDAKEKIHDETVKAYEDNLATVIRYYDNIKREVENNNALAMQSATGFRANTAQASENDSYEVEKQRLQALSDLYKQMSEDVLLTEEERKQASISLYQTMMDMEDLEIQHEIANNEIRKELIKEQVSTYQNFADSVGDVMGAVSDAWEANLRQRVEAGKVSQKEAEKEFERIKGLQIAQAIINTLAGSVGAFLQACSAYPPPWSFIIGGAAATTATISGIAQIAKIKATKFESSGNGGGSSISGFQVAQTPTADFNPNYQQNVTGQNEMDNLANAVSKGMQQTNMSVSVTEINDTQNRVRVRETESTF